jgi:hypothetical protein
MFQRCEGSRGHGFVLSDIFSDSSITPKTKAMKAEVETLREVVVGMNKAARIAVGEEKVGLVAKHPVWGSWGSRGGNCI